MDWLEQGRQRTTRVPHSARQAISNGTQKLQVLHINFDMIHKKYCYSWIAENTNVVGTLNGLEP